MSAREQQEQQQQQVDDEGEDHDQANVGVLEFSQSLKSRTTNSTSNSAPRSQRPQPPPPSVEPVRPSRGHKTSFQQQQSFYRSSSAMIKMKRPRAIILDIEGTTTSASYYPSAVAPYIRNNTEVYLRTHWNEEHVQSIVNDLRQQADQNPNMPKILDKSQGATMGDMQRSCLNHIEFLYRSNTTTIALLYFQMYVWLDGQMKGVLKTHVYRDVAEMIYKWKVEERVSIYIYSSARADVQMLMFACTEYGSLLHLIDGHFDSKIGQKTTNETYNRIAQAIQQQPQNIAFLTDDAKEARSAKSCGYKTVLVKRERKAFSPIESAQFDIVNSFDKIKFHD